jgi:hypothetical protein
LNRSWYDGFCGWGSTTPPEGEAAYRTGSGAEVLARVRGMRGGVLTDDTSAAPRSRSTRVVDVLTHPAVVAVAAVAVVLVYALLRSEWFIPRDDYAVTELAVQEAARLERLLGPYSRFGFFHPGPMYFYSVAPAFELLARNGGLAMVVTRLLIDAVCIVTVVVLIDRVGGRAAAWGATLAIALLEVRFGIDWFRDPWNPYVTVMPVVVALVAAASLHDGPHGRRARAILVVLAGSFAVQSHVGTAPLVALALVAALAGFVRSARGPHAGRWRRDALVVLAVALACWAIPIWQQLTTSPGNLGELVKFFREPNPHRPPFRPVLETVTGVVGLFSGHLGNLLNAEPFDWVPAPSWFTWLLVATLFAVLVASVVWWWRRGRAALAVLAAMVPVAYVLAIVSGLQIREGLQPYLFAPVLAVSAVAWIALGALVGELAWSWRPAVASVALPGLAIALVVVALVVGARAFDPLHESYGDATTGPLRAGIRELCDRGRPVRIVSDTAPWNRASEVGAALVDCGLDVTFAPRYESILGPERIARSTPGTLDVRLETPPIPRAEGWVRLARSDAASLDVADQPDATTRR